MIHKTGSLFDSTAPVLAHGVNLRGVMGAGIAKSFRDLYPVNYAAYRDACRRGWLDEGDCLLHYEGGKWIANLSTQVELGADADYDRLRAALHQLCSRVEQFRGRAPIAIPEIGCGIGGLEWDEVQCHLDDFEHMYAVEFEAWHFNG